MSTFYFFSELKINISSIFVSAQRMLHETNIDATVGLTAFSGCILPGVAGAVFLHPDFGIDKQNKIYRSVHKYASRALLLLAWTATISGLKTLIGDDIQTLIIFAAPLVLVAPFTLV